MVVAENGAVLIEKALSSMSGNALGLNSASGRSGRTSKFLTNAWYGCANIFEPAEIVELTFIIGYQTFASKFAKSFKLAPQGFSSRSPVGIRV